MQKLEQSKIKQPMLIIIMILIGTFGLISTDIYAPSLPLVPHLFNTSATNAQLTMSVFLMGFGVTQLIAGTLSDCYGRKPVLIIGAMIYATGTVLCIYSSSITGLLLGRAIEGIGAGAIAVLSRILLRDTFSGIQMAQIGSYLAACIGLSPAFAPVIGGVIQQHFGFSAIFIFLLLFVFLLLYLILFYLPETNRFRHLNKFSMHSISKKYYLVLSSKVFWSNVVAAGCGLAVIISCAVINPFLLQNTLKLSPAHYSVLACIAMSGMFLGMMTNGYFVEAMGINNMMIVGNLLILFAGSSLIICSLLSILTITNIILATFIVTFATAFILSNAIVGAFMPFAEVAGTVGAIYGCLQICITAITSTIISTFNIPSELLLGVVITLLMFVSMGVYYTLFAPEF